MSKICIGNTNVSIGRSPKRQSFGHFAATSEASDFFDDSLRQHLSGRDSSVPSGLDGKNFEDGSRVHTSPQRPTGFVNNVRSNTRPQFPCFYAVMHSRMGLL